MKVAIIASGHGKYEAPLGQEGWECWGLNQTWYWFDHPATEGKFARWFELHHRSFIDWENQGDTRHTAWMAKQDRLPIYVQDVEEWPDVATAKEFPMAEIQALLPDFGYYHACSIDWMIAYAITLGATEIALFGVEQEHSVEPHGSRSCMEFWLGFAAARGIKVWSAQGSTFKLAHLCYTKTPYAVDPTWLPYEDRTAGLDSYLGKHAARLKKVVKDYLASKDVR